MEKVVRRRTTAPLSSLSIFDLCLSMSASYPVCSPPHPFDHSASDEVATLEAHTINKDTDSNFCDLCVNRLPEGVSGCRAEFYTSERLKKCGVVVGNDAYVTVI